LADELSVPYTSYANPIRVALLASAREYSNASKFNQKNADFRCIFLKVDYAVKTYIIFNFLFPVPNSISQSACASQNFIRTLIFCQGISWLKLKRKKLLSSTVDYTNASDVFW